MGLWHLTLSLSVITAICISHSTIPLTSLPSFDQESILVARQQVCKSVCVCVFAFVCVFDTETFLERNRLSCNANPWFTRWCATRLFPSSWEAKRSAYCPSAPLIPIMPSVFIRYTKRISQFTCSDSPSVWPKQGFFSPCPLVDTLSAVFTLTYF